MLTCRKTIQEPLDASCMGNKPATTMPRCHISVGNTQRHVPSGTKTFNRRSQKISGIRISWLISTIEIRFRQIKIDKEPQWINDET